MKLNFVPFAQLLSQQLVKLVWQVHPSTSWITLVLVQLDSMKTMEHVQNVLLNVLHAKSPQLAILALTSTEISTTTAAVLLDFMMQVLTSVLNVIQAVLHAQVLQLVPLVMQDNSEPLRIQSVFVKMDISNLFSKMEQRLVPSVLQNAKLALNLQLNVPHVMLQSIELKVMTVWVIELVYVKLVIMPWLMELVSNPTVNLTSIAVNAKPILPCVFNVKLMLTELSNSQNTFAFALMDSMKELMELVNHVLLDVLNVLQPQIVSAVLLRPPITVMEHVNVLQDSISVFLPMELDIVSNVSNIVTSVQMD